ncbi:MAG: tryptophan--tRNA ligase [Aquificaceae bacterium]|nr:tryptophan--tRNA ligase [Aquificaceae bacterium]MDW8236873.1 tryptophan--tRNA ligase [Aquificaceae bacterium]
MRVLSGMRPTGKLHLGHVFVVKNWIELIDQNSCFFMVADLHALTSSYREPCKVNEDSIEMVLDWLSLGLDYSKVAIFKQSDVSMHLELSFLLSLITPRSWLEWNPTYKELRQNLLDLKEVSISLKDKLESSMGAFLANLPFEVKDIGRLKEVLLEAVSDSIIRGAFEGYLQSTQLQISKRDFFDVDTLGFFSYPVLQSADILLYKADLVPVGEDQLPHIELTRQIARRFNQLFGETLVEPKGVVSSVPRLPGTDGRKMSKSYGNAIFLTDIGNELKTKVMSFFTDPMKLRKSDPGRPELCPVFANHRIFTKSWPLEEIESDCKAGKLGCVECKSRLFESISGFLEPIYARRQSLDKSVILEVFESGAIVAKNEAQKTLSEVRKKLCLSG